MKISKILKSDECTISFEIFPPKKQEEIENIEPIAKSLKELNPGFVSVTCGAGGSGGKNTTIEVASILKNKYDIEAMAHMTCVSSSREAIRKNIAAVNAEGIENVLALRGDFPKDINKDSIISDYTYAYQLIKDLKNNSDFGIGAAAYPEGHIDCEDLALSVNHLKEKQENGAEFFVTQLCFNNDYIYKFLDMAARKGITVPITLGIMPMMSRKQVERMIFMCGATLPSPLIKIINKYGDNSDDLCKAGIEYAAKQIRELKKNQVDGIHIYCMNKPEVARELSLS